MAAPSILPPPIVPRRDVVTVEKIVRDDFEYKIVPAIEIELRSHFQMEPVTITTVFTTATSSNNPSGYLMNRKELKGFWLYSDTLQICEYIKAKPWSSNRAETDHVFQHLAEQKILMLWDYAKSHGLDRLDEIEGAIGTAARFVALRVFEKARKPEYEWPLDDEGKQL